MLEITIPGYEYYDDNLEEFIYENPRTIKLEHSLLSISKWESKWEKPFLGINEKTPEEMLDYIKCMTITSNVPDSVFLGLSTDNINKIEKYMNSKMTATTFSKENTSRKNGGKNITSELIYCWMASLRIPFETEKWHINRLLTLINVCSLEQQPPKKMDHKTAMNQQRALNQARRAKHHTRG